MKGFKKWLEDLDRREDDPDATVAYVPARPQSASKTPDYILSKHAWGTTPSGKNASTQADAAKGPAVNPNSLVYRISALLDPPDNEGRPGLDGHLRDRQKDGRSVAPFQGTPGYISPEEAKKAFTPTLDYEEDTVEALFSRCAELFVWLDKPCRSLAKLWLKFRSFLHMNEASKPHPVNYQTNIMRMKDCDQIFPQVDELVQTCKDSDKHVKLIGAWNSFYAAWNKIAPTLKHYLVTFEKNTPRR